MSYLDSARRDPLDPSYTMGEQSPLARPEAGGVEAYEPTLRDRIAKWLLGDKRPSYQKRQFVEGLMGSTGLGHTGMSVSDFTPAALPLYSYEGGRALAEGAPGQAVLDIASVAPGVGKGAAVLAKGAGHLLPAIFAGPGAKTANMAALKIAEVMETRGETREAIWKATGWFRGADSQWRFEIPDKSMRLKLPKQDRWDQLASIGKESAPVPTGQAVEHKQLFEAYPQLKETPLHAEYLPLSKVRGGVTPEGALVLNTGHPVPQQRSTA